MTISILTLFPEVFIPFFTTSILKKASKKNLVKISLVNIRDFATGSYKQVDDRPYGGGVGMVMRVDILHNAIQNVKCSAKGGSNVKCRERIILLDPRGEQFTQAKANELTKYDHLILICGHYEGVDERVRKHLVDEAISIGPYVLTGGEAGAIVITDAVVRLIPGVLKPQATADESFSTSTTALEYPQYTRPETYLGWKVPEILLCGNHSKIKDWRKKKIRSHQTNT